MMTPRKVCYVMMKTLSMLNEIYFQGSRTVMNCIQSVSLIPSCAYRSNHISITYRVVWVLSFTIVFQMYEAYNAALPC